MNLKVNVACNFNCFIETEATCNFRGHLRSLVLVQFDTPDAISY